MHLLRNFILVKVFVLCFSNHRSTEAYSLVGSGWCLTYAQRGPPAIWRNREEFDQYYCKQFANTKTTLECLEDLCNELSDCIAIDWKSNENVHLRFRSEESVINVCGDSPTEVYACRNFQTITNDGQGWQVWRGSEACKNNCDVTSSGGTWDGRQANGECFVKNDENLVREKIGCRSDICTDYFNDCCAPSGEPRGCSLPGYTVYEGGTSSSCGMHGSDAVYQCCTSPTVTYNGLLGLIFAIVVALMLV